MDSRMLAGKVAIITGASYGMGQTIAEVFAEEGASVVITARGQEKLDAVVARIQAKGGKAIGVVADVCSTEDTKRVFEETLKAFGRLDILINISSVNGTRPFCGATYTSTKGALNTLTKNVAMRLIDTNIRCNAVAPGATITPAHIANKAGQQPGGDKMLQYSGHFVYFPGPECQAIDQAYACLYLASKMGRAVKGQVLQVCNGAFL